MISLTFCNNAYSENLRKHYPPHIKAIYSLKEAENVLDELDSDSLVIFDVDDTLIYQMDRAVRAQYFYGPVISKLWKELATTCKKPGDIDYMNFLVSKVFTQSKRALVEPQILQFLESLRKKKIKVVGLTHLQTGTFGVIPQMEEWRFQQLKNLGIDFSESFKQDIRFENFTESRGQIPLFHKGILLTHDRTKGEVLEAFLDKLKLKPTRIVFFDDWFDYHSSVAEMLQKRQIPYQGYHYLATYRLPGKFDQRIAEMQFKHLRDHEEWIKDQDATTLLFHESQRRVVHD